MSRKNTQKLGDSPDPLTGGHRPEQFGYFISYYRFYHWLLLFISYFIFNEENRMELLSTFYFEFEYETFIYIIEYILKQVEFLIKSTKTHEIKIEIVVWQN